MILKIAWRNIWRNKIRSLVIISAVILGIWALIFMNAWMNGLANSYVANAINNELAHLQIHQKKFREERAAKYFIRNSNALLKKVQEIETVNTVSSRTIITAMLSSARKNAAIQVIGINPELEQSISQLDQKITEGNYLSNKKKRKIPILISQQTAEKMKLKIRSKLNLRFQSLEGDLIMGCKVVGIFNSGNAKLDQGIVYVNQKDLNTHFAPQIPDFTHEIAIKLKDTKQMDEVQNRLQQLVPDLLVENYREISPDVDLMETQIKSSSYIFIVIIMIALIFGIINTMLMAVLERVRELGMLMALGMKKSLIFSMIMMETILLGVMGAPIGLLLAAITVYYTNSVGIDLSAYEEAMQQFGMMERVRPEVNPPFYLQTSMAILCTTIFAAIYPGLKAIRLNPIASIRKI